MVIVGSLQLSHEFGLCMNHWSNKQYKSISERSKFHLLNRTPLLNVLHLRQYSRSNCPSENLYRHLRLVPYRSNAFKCHSFQVRNQGLELPALKAVSTAVVRSYNALQGSPFVIKMVPAVGLIIFALWGLMPIVRQSRNVLLDKGDNGWKKSSTHFVATSCIQPLLLWTGALLVCRALDPVVLPTAASQIVKQRLLNFVRSLSTVLVFAYCLSSLIEQTQKFFMETSEPGDARNMGFQFAGKAIYSAVWVAAASLFMELLGFSTQKWLTAGGLGTVLLTLAGREIFTNFLSSAMIHATRPFVVNEWIQTKIEGYDVSGTVEHVGWWSPSIVRGEDREAIHIPNHKFTMNVVRNLTQKTHWRIKTHLAISQLDGHKIKNVVSDMRKVLAKNPQVEQQRLHRRVFFDNVNPENQAFLIMVSCFVKTSHYEEYLRVKETILLDLLRVISHHGARLATPIRTMQKTYSDVDVENIPFPDSIFSRGGVNPNRRLLLIDSYKVNGEDKAKSKTTGRSASDIQADPKAAAAAESKEVLKAASAESMEVLKAASSESKEIPRAASAENKEVVKAASASASTSAPKTSSNNVEMTSSELKVLEPVSTSDSLAGDKATVKSTSKSAPKMSSNNVETTSSAPKVLEPVSTSDSLAGDKATVKSTSKSAPKMNSNNEVTSNSDPKVLEPVSADNKPVKNSSPSQAAYSDKSSVFRESSQTQEGERPSVSQPAVSSIPTLEENVVLGVALEGSKRTLPIEEELASPSTPEVKELTAAHLNGNGSLPEKKDRKDGQIPANPNSSTDHRDKPER